MAIDTHYALCLSMRGHKGIIVGVRTDIEDQILRESQDVPPCHPRNLEGQGGASPRVFLAGI